MSEHSQKEGDKEEDSDAKRVVAHDAGQASDAVLSRRAIVDLLEVIEEAWVAYAVAVQRLLHVLCELRQTRRNHCDLRLVTRIHCCKLSVYSTQVSVAVPEVVIGTVGGGAELEWDKLSLVRVCNQRECSVEMVGPLLNSIGSVLICVA